MSTMNKPHIASFKAEADLSSSQYCAVKHGATDVGVVLAGAEQGMGVLMNAPVSGKPAEVALLGGCAKVLLSGTVTRGDSLMVDANGKFLLATSTKKCLAVAMASGVSGDIVEVQLQKHYNP